MTIKKYELSDAVSEQSLQSSTESHAMMAQASGNEPITSFFDFIRQLCDGTWNGGNVTALGYVSKNEFVKTDEPGEYPEELYYSGLITRFVHSSQNNAGFDFDSYLSNMYSLMYVSTTPSSNSSSEPNTSNQNSNEPEKDRVSYFNDTIDYGNIKVDYEVVTAGSYVIVNFSITKNFSGPCGLCVTCNVGEVSDTIFDGTNAEREMYKEIVATKSYQRNSNDRLMTLHFYLPGSPTHILTIA